MRIAVRRLAAAPGFTGVAVLVIAVAIAANASVFLLVDAVFLRPFPFEDPEGLLQLWTVHERGETPYVKAGLAEEWRGLPDTLAAVEPYEYRAPTLIGFGEPDIVPAAVVSGGLMPALGVRPLLGRTDAEQPILEVATAEDVYASFFGAPRFYAYVMSVFAALALLLAAVGLYGVMSYAVAHRAREFGIRLALGAAPAQLRGGVLQRGLWLVSAGTATGFAISLLATRLLETQLVGIHRLDVATYGMVLILAAAMALAACWAPAHRASRTDPAVTLRADA